MCASPHSILDAADGHHLWSERYDREIEDVFALQDEIAATIASNFRTSLALNTAERAQRATHSIEAFEAILKGRALLPRRGKSIVEGIACMERALALDPDAFLSRFALQISVAATGNRQRTLDASDSLFALGGRVGAPLTWYGVARHMRRYNIIGVLGGSPELVAVWRQAAPGRFIAGLDLRFDAASGAAGAATPIGAEWRPLPVDSVRALYSRGAFAVLAEVMNQFAGLAPDDPRLDAYWALAEELDIPVGIHVGGGGPGEPYAGNPAFRARLQSALTLEDVLVRHPKLRLYVMHAGYPLLEDLQALLFTYPQVYVELSMAINVETRPAFYRFLRALVEAGYGDRIMFGSDQMVWPGLSDAAVRSLQEAPFLTARQKRDIFYDNAARFLRLPPAAIARHHALAADGTPR